MPPLEPPSGPVRDEVRRLLRLAWPVVLSQIGLVTMGVVDLFAVRRLGPTATAAVGIGNALSFAASVLLVGASAGLDPLVSQAYGAGSPRTAGAEAMRGAVLVLGLCVPITLVHLAAAPILGLLGQPPDAIPGAAAFCRVLALSVVPYGGFAVVRTVLQGGGSMRPAMWVVLGANLVNLVSSFTLARGWGPIPGFGVVGVAWSTATVRWLMWFGLIAISWRELREVVPRGPVLVPAELARVAATALPVAFQLGLEVWSFNAATFLAGMLGATEAAAHTSALSAASLAFMLPFGTAVAASTRVGNLVGAGLPWRRSAAIALGMGAAFMSVSALVFVTAPSVVGRLYNPDPAVVAAVAIILPIAGMFQLFDGVQVVGSGVLRGLGDTRVPLLFNAFAHWFVGLPLGIVLAFWAGLGLPGVWLGLTAGLGTVSMLLLARIGWFARQGATRPARAAVEVR